MNEAIKQAFRAARDGYSPDRVVADPALNERFIAECRARGITDGERELNKALLNVRKASGLAAFPTGRQTRFRHTEEYAFASEIAARYVEQRDGVALDDILCDPRLALEFDAVAARISPGFSSLEYRWAALRLRKRKRLRPERVSQAVRAEVVENLPVTQLHLALLPPVQGLYVFYSAKVTLYVGETRNLRKRIAKHLEHSDNKGFAHWLWEFGTDEVHLEYHVLPNSTPTRVRRALEAELIESRRAEFNIART